MIKFRTDDFKHFDSKSKLLIKFQLHLNCREFQSLPETGRKPYLCLYSFLGSHKAGPVTMFTISCEQIGGMVNIANVLANHKSIGKPTSIFRTYVLKGLLTTVKINFPVLL